VLPWRHRYYRLATVYLGQAAFEGGDNVLRSGDTFEADVGHGGWWRRPVNRPGLAKKPLHRWGRITQVFQISSKDAESIG
jgi:hypothetical protein